MVVLVEVEVEEEVVVSPGVVELVVLKVLDVVDWVLVVELDDVVVEEKVEVVVLD